MPRVSAKRIEKMRGRALPLEQLPAHLRDRILEQVEQPTPPNRWLAIGAPGIPRPLAWLPSRGRHEWHWARGIDPDGSRPPIPKPLRAKVIERDGYICGLCGGNVEPTDVHLDHIRPWSKGGPTALDNLQVSHSRCNILKGARDV